MREMGQIEFSKNNGNLHLSPIGDFDDTTAWQLSNLLHEHYTGKENIIIDTYRIGKINPFGKTMLTCRLELGCIPANCLSFEGEKAHEIAPEGSEVIVEPEKEHCRCSGDCSNCSCSGKKADMELQGGWIHL